MKRRSFLQMVGMAGGGLLLGVAPSGCVSVEAQRMASLAEKTGEFSPNMFISVTPEDRVLLAMNVVEFGQGTMTGFATVVAEELDVPIESVDAFLAYKDEFGLQLTGGSLSTSQNFMPLRRAAASAREMIVAAAAAQWGVSASECVTDDGVVSHPSGKTARYGELTQAAAALDIVSEPKLKNRSEFKKIGKRTTRVDAFAKVTGQAVFGTDVTPEGKLSAYVIRPEKFGAKPVSFDASKATSMTGVVEIFAFERGVAVVAQKYWQARRAAKAVTVKWGKGLLEGFDSEKLRAAALERVERVGDHVAHAEGDVERELASDDVTVVEASFHIPHLAHAPMEPQNATALVTDDGVTLWVPTQAPTATAGAIANYLDVPAETVDVKQTLIGGGFGRRSVVDFALDAAMVARRMKGQPVQVIWSREDDTRLGFYRPHGAAKVRGAVDANGEVVAADVHVAIEPVLRDQGPVLETLFASNVARSAMAFIDSGSIGDVIALEGINETAYDFASYRISTTAIRTKVPVNFWRSVGNSYSGFVMESFVDMLAGAAKKDPVAMREHLLRDSPRHLAVLRAAVAGSKWGRPIEEGWGRGVAVHKSFGSFVAYVVEAGIVDGRIAVRHVSGAVDCGLVVNPDMVVAQIESGIIYGLSMMRQKIDFVDGAVQQGNFDTYPALRMYESPEIVTQIIESDEDPTGIGEPGLPPITPATANAIFAATGVRLTHMPIQFAWDEHAETTKEVAR